MSLKSELTLFAPAKINLYLDIVGKLDNGYHLLETIMHTISLNDIITISPTKNGEIVLYTDDLSSDIPSDDGNIVVKATKEFYKNCPDLFTGLNISLEKFIPSQAGLGGGSADAAAILRGLYSLHNQPFSEDLLYKTALKLGADVPFCLKGGCGICHGIGEKITPLPPLSDNIWICIGKGEKGISTKSAFSEIDRLGFAQYQTEKITKLYGNRTFESLLFNRFEDVTNIFEINQIKEVMMNTNAVASAMSGSGSAVFGIFKDKISCESASKKLKSMGFFSAVCNPMCY